MRDARKRRALQERERDRKEEENVSIINRCDTKRRL